MDRREAERGRGLVAAVLAAQHEHDRAKAAVDAARKAVETLRAELNAWLEAAGDVTLVFGGRAVRLTDRVEFLSLVSLDPPAPTPPPQPAPTPPQKKEKR